MPQCPRLQTDPEWTRSARILYQCYSFQFYRLASEGDVNHTIHWIEVGRRWTIPETSIDSRSYVNRSIYVRYECNRRIHHAQFKLVKYQQNRTPVGGVTCSCSMSFVKRSVDLTRRYSHWHIVVVVPMYVEVFDRCFAKLQHTRSVSRRQYISQGPSVGTAAGDLVYYRCGGLDLLPMPSTLSRKEQLWCNR